MGTEILNSNTESLAARKSQINYLQYSTAIEAFEHLKVLSLDTQILLLFDSDGTLRNSLGQGIRGQFGRVPEDMLIYLEDFLNLTQENIIPAIVTDQPTTGHQIASLMGNIQGYTPAPQVYRERLQIPVFGSARSVFTYKRLSQGNILAQWVGEQYSQNQIDQIWYIGDAGVDQRFFERFANREDIQALEISMNFAKIPSKLFHLSQEGLYP